MWCWKLDLLQVTWSPKDSQLPCSICCYISVFFPSHSMIHRHMRFNAFLQTVFVESCLLLLYTMYFWPLGFPSSVLWWLWDQAVFEGKHHTHNPSCLPSCQDNLGGSDNFLRLINPNCDSPLLFSTSSLNGWYKITNTIYRMVYVNNDHEESKLINFNSGIYLFVSNSQIFSLYTHSLYISVNKKWPLHLYYSI